MDHARHVRSLSRLLVLAQPKVNNKYWQPETPTQSSICSLFTPRQIPIAIMADPLGSHGDILARLHLRPEFSDLNIKCQGREFPVHKAIVCAYSPVIHAAMKHDFEEARTGVYTMDSFDPQTVDAMVSYMYHGNHHASHSVEPVTEEDISDKTTQYDGAVSTTNSNNGNHESSSAESANNVLVGNGASESIESVHPRAASIVECINLCHIAHYFDIESLEAYSLKLLDVALKQFLESERVPECL